MADHVEVVSVSPADYLALSALRQFGADWESHRRLLQPTLRSVTTEALFEAAFKLRIVHLVRKAYLDDSRIRSRRSPFQLWHLAAVAAYECQVSAWNVLARRLREERVSPVLFKGIHLASTCYPDDVVPLMKDIDFFVQRKDLRATCAVLDGLGYSQHVRTYRGKLRSVTAAEIAANEQQLGYELAAFGLPAELKMKPRTQGFVRQHLRAFPFFQGRGLRANRVEVLIRATPHFNVRIPHLETKDLLKRVTKPPDRITPDCDVFDGALTTYFLSMRVYAELATWDTIGPNHSPGKLLGDLVMVCSKGDIDYPDLVKLAVKYDDTYVHYYNLAFVQNWVGIGDRKLKAAVALLAKKSRHSGRDRRSDVLPHLFGPQRRASKGRRTEFRSASQPEWQGDLAQ